VGEAVYSRPSNAEMLCTPACASMMRCLIKNRDKLRLWYGRLRYGDLCDFLPQRFLVILRTLLLGGGGLLLLFGSEAVGFAGAGPLGCVVTAFVANWGWKAQGWTDETVSSETYIMTWIYRGIREGGGVCQTLWGQRTKIFLLQWTEFGSFTEWCNFHVS
jgi:hypothetical protein